MHLSISLVKATKIYYSFHLSFKTQANTYARARAHTHTHTHTYMS